MKSITFTTNKGTFLIKDLDAQQAVFHRAFKTRLLRDNQAYAPIGLIKELTENEAAEIVDNNGLGCFDNYKGIPDNRYTFETALESFHSLLLSMDVLLENNKPHPGDFQVTSRTQYMSMKTDWQKSQEKVWSNPYLFKLIEE